MKILVTGGTGYIGSHTVVELINAGFDVLIADNLDNSRIEVLDGIEKICGRKPIFEQIDLCNREKTISLFSNYPDISAVIHFAAHKAVGESVEKPSKYYYNNLCSLLNILVGMTQSVNCNMIVFSSSCTVYGEPDSLPVDENAPVKKATSPYGNTKQIAEEIIFDHVRASPGVNCISLRYFNPIGAHPTGQIGELPIGQPNNLVPFITQTAYGVREILSVFGNDYNTIDGTCIRDYINVCDLAKAHITALRRMIGGKCKERFEVFNLGTGNGVSVLEIIKCFEKTTGEKLNYKIVDRRSGDVEEVYADPTFANMELGWFAETPLEETLLSAWNWEKKYRNSNKL